MYTIHSKSEKNGGVYFYRSQNWRKKYVNRDKKTSDHRILGKIKKIGGD